MNQKTKSFILKWLFLDLQAKTEASLLHWSYLIVRVSMALIMLFAHGLGKLSNFSSIAPNFPDPLKLGSTLSLFLVTGAEFFGAILLAFGLCTRWASFSLFFTMLVAAFVLHWPDPFKQKELAVLYGLLFFLFTVTGGGKYSLDDFLKKQLK